MWDSPLVAKIVALALEEDLSDGDITSKLCVQKETQGIGVVTAKEALVVCGLPIIRNITALISKDLLVKDLVQEGSEVAKGTGLAEIKGPLEMLLAAERTILNFLQRMCGVATFTRQLKNHAPKITLLDTRKTQPGWRILDKYATMIGGAKNHRMHLGDMVLVKNNHIDSAPGETQAQKMEFVLNKVFSGKPEGMPVEIEVRNLEELKIALRYAPQMLMLDNMNDDEVSAALREIEKAKHQAMVEVSGGISAERLPRLEARGVKYASVGALTTKATNVDISLCIRAHGR